MQSHKAKLLLVGSHHPGERLGGVLAQVDPIRLQVEREDRGIASEAGKSACDVCLLDGTILTAPEFPKALSDLDSRIAAPVIVLTQSREAGVAALAAGAADYIEACSLNSDLLERSVRYVLQKSELARQAARLDGERSVRRSLQKRNFRLKLLAEAAGELSTVEDPVDLLGRFYPRLAAHLGLDCYLHYLVGESPETLVLNGCAGVPEESLGELRHMDFAAIVSPPEPCEGEPGPGKTVFGQGSLARRLGLSAYFWYPLMVQGQILGAVAFGSRRRRRFSSSEIVFLRTLCHYIATTLERHRLGRELSDRAGRLAESEHRFRAMAETVPDFLLSGSTDGSCDFCNQQFCGYTGLTQQQVAGAGWLSAMHPEDAELVRQAWPRLCEQGESLEIEHRFRTVEGSYRWFVGRWRGVRGPDGGLLRWIGSCADIDDLKRVEAALRENQSRLHQAVAEAERRAAEAEEGRRILEAIMDHVPIGIAVADRPDALRFVSRQGREMLVKSAPAGSESASQRTGELDEIISPHRDNSLLARAIRGETINNQEIVIRKRSGQAIPLLCSSGPVRDRLGRITGAVVTWVDIADRKRGERILKQSERQFRAVFETSPDCIVMVDDEMRMVKVNPATCSVFGLDADSLIGRSMAEYLCPDDRLDEVRRELLQTGRYTGEVQITRPDGKVLDFDLGAAFSFVPGRHLLVFHNTTERRMMERRLRDSESRFRTLAQALPQIVWTATPDGSHDFFSGQLTEACGLSVEEACRDGWSRLIHPEDAQRCRDAWTAAVQTGRNFEIEHRLAEKDGNYRWFLTRSVPLRNEAGQIVKWFGSTTDIHDQKLAEQTLSREHAAVENERRRLRAVLDVLPVAVFIADQQGRITDVNPAVSHTWGRLPVLSSSLGEFSEYYRGFWAKSGKTVPMQERGLCRAIRNGESVAGEEMEYLRGDGKRGSLLNYAEPIRDASGQIIGGVAVSVDITDLKRTQKQLLELNDALEQRVRDRTRSLVTYQEHLRAMASEVVVTEQRERRRLATELHDYLAQLLVASKMKSKLVSYHVQASGEEAMKELRDLIDESLKYTRTLIADLSPTILYEAGLFAAIHWLGEQMTRHNLEVHIDEDGEPVGMPDDKAVMVFQIVRELLFNVVKHAKVSEATVRVNQARPGELTVTVEDAGAGFDPSRQELHPAGGKFGLFSVRERLAALGGSFEIDSAPGRGTRAVARVPLEPGQIDDISTAPATAPVTPSVAVPHRRGTIRVLLVDDHKMVREGFRTLIECDAQLEVAGEAANGEEAVELARLLHPDVVIMDINMPRMNGIEATRRIKQEMPHISIIGLSVHDDRGLIASMLEAGASCYLTKGGQSEELSRAIHATYEAQLGQSGQPE